MGYFYIYGVFRLYGLIEVIKQLQLLLVSRMLLRIHAFFLWSAENVWVVSGCSVLESSDRIANESYWRPTIKKR
jgi:hypothetical protein